MEKVAIQNKLLLTVKEAAALIGVAPQFMQNEIKSGRLPFKILPDHISKYIRRVDLDKYLEKLKGAA